MSVVLQHGREWRRTAGLTSDVVQIEWVPGRVKKVNQDGSFMVHIIVIKSDERGEWEETYKPDEEGTEWRWPISKARRT